MALTPIRYPGGKSRVADQIVERMPKIRGQFWEPMVGGGSVFLTVRQQFPGVQVNIGDKNHKLMTFWRTLRDDPVNLMRSLFDIQKRFPDADMRKMLWDQIRSGQSGLDTATQFFFVNRCSFSGSTESGGFSRSAAMDRFTKSSVCKLSQVSLLLQGVRMWEGDVKDILSGVPARDTVYLDPPYSNVDKLYGKNGDLHAFDHAALAQLLQSSSFSWSLSYDDSTEIQSLYEGWADVSHLQVQYGMSTGGKTRKIPVTRELLISREAPLYAVWGSRDGV